MTSPRTVELHEHFYSQSLCPNLEPHQICCQSVSMNIQREGSQTTSPLPVLIANSQPATNDACLSHMAILRSALFSTAIECIGFDAGDLRKPTHCVYKRLEGYVLTRIAVIVTERIVKIPD